ncbi:MAG: N-succinylarginine dihydrolase [Deltaproteobacteria bacterium]|nr:N-succinylarginine dihydrolase [Deltaproteobacteria bacterium]
MSKTTETNFDGLVGLTHNYGGLSTGNNASTSHSGLMSHPKAAALQGIAKMRFNRSLGLSQGVFLPHERPNLSFLRSIGFSGSDEAVLSKAATSDGGHALRLASSAAAMWTANAATVAPSRDADDGKVHLLTANLQEMMHRALEADGTFRMLSAIFNDDSVFSVHKALPGGGHYADEGAANHTRLFTEQGSVHLFAWGRSAFQKDSFSTTKINTARQTLEASLAVKRHLRVEDSALLWQQAPEGIDAGAFHTDVLAVGNENLMLYHELAFSKSDALIDTIRERLGEQFVAIRASSDELPVEDAVAAYPFNSQLVTLPSGKMAIIAPKKAQENPAAFAFLERVKAESSEVVDVHYLDVKESMQNGGGPACLRLRVPLQEKERKAISARVILDDGLEADLVKWVEKSHREELMPDDLEDPQLWRESLVALDELTTLLNVGSIYDFQRA